MIRLNWDRVKQLHLDLESDGWQENDQLLFVIIEKGGKPKKATVKFKELYRFCWDLTEDEEIHVLTFMIQDREGKVLYRHKLVVGNEEVPNGGNADVISHWAALTEDEKHTYVTMLVSQINAYER